MTATDAGALAERTAWFDPATLPARAGVYERRAPAGPFACWDGVRWRRDVASIAAAARQEGASKVPRAAWRGLVEPSPAPCATCRGRTVLDRGIDVATGSDLIEECPDC